MLLDIYMTVYIYILSLKEIVSFGAQGEKCNGSQLIFLSHRFSTAHKIYSSDSGGSRPGGVFSDPESRGTGVSRSQIARNSSEYARACVSLSPVRVFPYVAYLYCKHASTLYCPVTRRQRCAKASSSLIFRATFPKTRKHGI